MEGFKVHHGFCDFLKKPMILFNYASDKIRRNYNSACVKTRYNFWRFSLVWILFRRTTKPDS